MAVADNPDESDYNAGMASFDPLDPVARVAIRGSSPQLARKMLEARKGLEVVQAHMGQEKFAALATYGDSAWVPMPLYEPFVRAIYETQGNTHDTAIAFWREHGGLIMASPLLKEIGRAHV